MLRHPLVRLAIFLALVTLAFLNQNGTLARWFGPPATNAEQKLATAPAADRAPASDAASATSAASASRRAPPEGERHPEIGFRTREQLAEHFRKHGAEFSAATAETYLKLAQALRDDPVGPNIREEVRADGVICRFHAPSGSFLAFNEDLTIRTFFRPTDGEAYFNRQLERGP